MTESDKRDTAELGEMKRKARAVRDASIVRMAVAGRKLGDIKAQTGASYDAIKRILRDAGVEWAKVAPGWKLPDGLP